MADTLPTDLAKVDPADAWAAYRPSAAAPWDRKQVAHLYRRAAFGPSPADTERALKNGFEKTLDRLMTGEPGAAHFPAFLTETGQYLRADTTLRVWWLYTMIEGGHPLREKLTLFWHNHFATSYAKIQDTRLMLAQNLLLRKHALGKFRPFLLDMSKDAAMLKWLDSNQNIVGAPNENFAREVMELFSLGVGNYSEKDIQEAARAFTGWHVDTLPNTDEETFQYKPVWHDGGSKSIFGKTGNWNGDDVVRFCCDRPSCATFLVGKLYAFLVSETPPPKDLLAPLAERLRKSDFDIADLVKAMLGSRLFFSPHAYRKRVKWPVEYALGAVRAVLPDRAPPGDFLDPLAKMGQVLFAPPNVKGWRTGTDWLNSATLLARNNFAETVATGNWPKTNQKGPRNGTFAKVATPVEATDAAEAFITETPQQQAANAAVVGGATAYSPVREIIAPDGTRVPIMVFAEGPGGGAPPPPPRPPTTGSGAPPKPGAPPAAPPVDPKLDPVETLFKPKPTTASALIKRMGELLYGEDVPAAARTKIEKFLLDGRKSLGEKDIENAAFRPKVREALHALMCLPEYQLN